MAQGWSPNTTRDVSAEELARLRADPAAFLRAVLHPPPTITMADGSEVPRLPGCVLWMWDGAFCGAINLRHQFGTEALPPHVSGHVGYAVVPWKRRRGYATRALALMLPVAARAGLARVELTCDADNDASRRVIEANGGVRQPGLRDAEGHPKLAFWVPTGRPDA
ncbi:MAG: hypothetical protein ABS99_01380 [Acetobacteraceae bacterium SCN 69-10]|nr:MAG: hypothetical protein ABS99_01380 [Acetobacteraceae bacterium SCN 69-10]OJY64252.1 MAG: hypothetical protein BGP12_16780 [Rhodospirillales bacterium 70-18]